MGIRINKGYEIRENDVKNGVLKIDYINPMEKRLELGYGVGYIEEVIISARRIRY